MPARGQLEGEPLIELFISEAERVNVTVARVDGMQGVPAAVAGFLREANLPARLKLAADPLVAAIPWASEPLLACSTGAAAADDTAAVSAAFAGIAETGTRDDDLRARTIRRTSTSCRKRTSSSCRRRGLSAATRTPSPAFAPRPGRARCRGWSTGSPVRHAPPISSRRFCLGHTGRSGCWRCWSMASRGRRTPEPDAADDAALWRRSYRAGDTPEEAARGACARNPRERPGRRPSTPGTGGAPSPPAEPPLGSAAKPPPEPQRPPVLAPGIAPGLDQRTLNRLKRGLIPPESRIDLHNMTQDEAHRALSCFLAAAQAAGRRVRPRHHRQGVRCRRSGRRPKDQRAALDQRAAEPRTRPRLHPRLAHARRRRRAVRPAAPATSALSLSRGQGGG